MPKVGDRVIIEGAKIGQQRREGSLVGITGSLLNIRWADGTSSLLSPGAGSVTFLPKGGSTGKKTPAKKPAAKKTAAVKKPAADKPAAKAKAAGKPAKKKTKK